MVFAILQITSRQNHFWVDQFSKPLLQLVHPNTHLWMRLDARATLQSRSSFWAQRLHNKTDTAPNVLARDSFILSTLSLSLSLSLFSHRHRERHTNTNTLSSLPCLLYFLLLLPFPLVLPSSSLPLFLLLLVLTYLSNYLIYSFTSINLLKTNNINCLFFNLFFLSEGRNNIFLFLFPWHFHCAIFEENLIWIVCELDK